MGQINYYKKKQVPQAISAMKCEIGGQLSITYRILGFGFTLGKGLRAPILGMFHRVVP